MKDSYNRVETVDQLSIPIAVILELSCFDLKEIEDIIGRLAALDCLGEGTVGEVYPGLFEVVGYCSIENELKVRRGGC
jgi:hypothetical protein